MRIGKTQKLKAVLTDLYCLVKKITLNYYCEPIETDQEVDSVGLDGNPDS